MTFPDALRLLKNQSLPSLVQEELERMILEGRLLPGEQLREAALAALLGISRGPIREAFRGLDEKGLVTVVKNCGVYVRTLKFEEADQIYEVRIVLEAMIGQKAALAAGKVGIKALHGILAEMKEALAAAAINRYTALNFNFHDKLASLTGNQKLHETYQRLVGELSLFRRQTYVHDESSMLTSLHEHQAIFEAIASQQAELAAELLMRHASDSRDRLRRVFEDASAEDAT